MPNCESYAALINAAVDGELLPEERTRLMDHLAACPACREQYTQLMAIHTAFADWDVDVPEGLTDAVMEQIHAQRRRPRRRWVQLGVAAACCAVVLLGTQVLHSLSPRNNIRATDPAPVSDGEEDSQTPPPANNTAEDDASDGSLSEPPQVDPTLKAALTYFTSGDSPSVMSNDLPSNGESSGSDLYAATLTCEDIAMETWMTEHIQDEAYVSTDSSEALSAFAWLISYADYTELTGYLAENNIAYSQEMVQADTALSDGDMIRVVYLEPTDAQ